MINLALTVSDIKTIARALIYCQVDAEDNRDNAKGEAMKDYYQRRVQMYSDAWQDLYAAIDRAGENADDVIAY